MQRVNQCCIGMSFFTYQTKAHFRQGSKEQGPMKLSIPIGQELLIGPKAFRQEYKTKTNQFVI